MAESHQTPFGVVCVSPLRHSLLPALLTMNMVRAPHQHVCRAATANLRQPLLFQAVIRPIDSRPESMMVPRSLTFAWRSRMVGALRQHLCHAASPPASVSRRCPKFVIRTASAVRTTL